MDRVPAVGGISSTDFQAELGRLGCKASPKQLENWRHDGLLPRPDFYGVGHRRHHPGEARQAVALERILAHRNRLDDAGAILWAAGFDVDQRYWSRRLQGGATLLRRIKPVVGWLIERVERSDASQTIGDRFAQISQLSGAMAKVARRLDAHQAARLINVATEITTGEFSGFENYRSDQEESGSQEIFEHALDFAGGEKHTVFGAQLTLGNALEGALISASEAQTNPLEELSGAEIDAARQDVQGALKIAICMYDALSWIYGERALGLRFAAFMARNATIDLIYFWIAGFARLRRANAELYSSAQIAEMANQAELAWLISTYFRDIGEVSPELARQFDQRRWKAAISSSIEHQKLLKDLELVQFPKADFQPWNSWRKLAKKTMPPGLLAMSIGAPTHLSRSDFEADASGPKNP
jgi:hypothetical protein